MGFADQRSFSSYHPVLSRATWSSRELARRLFLRLVCTFVPEEAPMILGTDETLERRRGAKIASKGSTATTPRAARACM